MMKNLSRICALALGLAATGLRSEPPTFSQHDMCCWLASWVQFVYNLKPLVDEFLDTEEQIFTNLDDFKKLKVIQKDTMKKVPRFKQAVRSSVDSDLEDAEKYNFSPNAIEITKAYRWFASWEPFVYNLKPLVNEFLDTKEQPFANLDNFKKLKVIQKDTMEKVPRFKRAVRSSVDNEFLDTKEQLFTNLDDFKKLKVIQKDTMKEVPRFIGSDLEDAEKYNFSPNAIEITKAYRSLFKAIRNKETTIDDKLTELQQKIQGEQFGACIDIKTLLSSESQTNSLIKHPLLAQYSTIEEGGFFINRIAERKEYANIFTKFIIYASSKVPEFTVDLTPVVTDKIKKEHDCLIYDLIGIILYIPGSTGHYIVFIKDQYDPEQTWWRCDTLSGNKRVSEEEIMQKCTQNQGTKTAAYCARDCKKGTV